MLTNTFMNPIRKINFVVPFFYRNKEFTHTIVNNLQLVRSVACTVNNNTTEHYVTYYTIDENKLKNNNDKCLPLKPHLSSVCLTCKNKHRDHLHIHVDGKIIYL